MYMCLYYNRIVLNCFKKTVAGTTLWARNEYNAKTLYACYIGDIIQVVRSVPMDMAVHDRLVRVAVRE